MQKNKIEHTNVAQAMGQNSFLNICKNSEIFDDLSYSLGFLSKPQKILQNLPLNLTFNLWISSQEGDFVNFYGLPGKPEL